VNLLLDTAPFLWIALGRKELSRSALDAVTDEDNLVYLSAVSSWEISVKYALGKLELPERPESLIPQIRAAYAIEPLPLDEDATFQVGKLPNLHRDPFDRILMSQAITHGLTLLTPDKQIQAYPIRTAW